MLKQQTKAIPSRSRQLVTLTSAFLITAGAVDVRGDAPKELSVELDSELAGGIVRSDQNATELLSLTIDGEWNPAIIEVLEKYNMPAAYFVAATNVKDFPDSESLRKAKRADCSIGMLVDSSRDATLVESLLRSAHNSGFPIGLIRYRSTTKPSQLSSARKLGITHVGWSINAKNLGTRSIMSRISRGGVIRFPTDRLLKSRLDEFLDALEGENCKRITARKAPITPVSLHYFIHDENGAREVPEHVQSRTAAYVSSLPDRCRERKAPLPKGDYPIRKRTNINQRCVDDPLAKGCL